MIRLARRDPLSAFLLFASIAILVLFFALLGSLGPEGSGRQVDLSVVTKLAHGELVREATLLDYDHQVVLQPRQGERVYADFPASDASTQQLFDSLTRGGAQVGIDPQSGKSARVIVVQFLLPILLLVCLFTFFIRQGAGSSNRLRAFSSLTSARRRRKQGTARVGFADVAGAGEAVTELSEVLDFLRDPQRYEEIGAAAPKGILLVGPPGTGKTLLARATAGEADASFLAVSGAEFVESLVGVGAARIRDLFAKARKSAPTIVFIDELDAAGRKRGAGVGQGNDEREQTLNQLLVELDGFGSEAGVVVMAATNRPDILDPALLRPGRFDRQVVVDVPDLGGRIEILGSHGARRALGPDVDLAEIARLCPGFTGADLANVVNEAALLSVREGRTEIDQRTLEEGIERVVAGPARRSRLLSEEDRRTIAIHEAGHAVVSHATGQEIGAHKLSIVSRGRNLGTAVEMLADRDAVLHRRSDLERQLETILAGAAGEKIEYGEESTMAGDDLHAATEIARRMVTSFGMSELLGPVTIGEASREVFLGASLQDLGSTSPQTLGLIDGETRRLVTEALGRAETVLRSNWDVVIAIADRLLEVESISGVELDELLDGRAVDRG